MAVLTIIGRKVIVSREGVASFNRGWPCSELSDARTYWFEFDSAGDLIDTDVPEHSDGGAAKAMAEDCRAYLLEGDIPTWTPGILAEAVAATRTPHGRGYANAYGGAGGNPYASGSPDALEWEIGRQDGIRRQRRDGPAPSEG